MPSGTTARTTGWQYKARWSRWTISSGPSITTPGWDRGQIRNTKSQPDIYGGTHHFITAELERFGIEFSFASNRSEALSACFRDNTKLVYIETPSNPLLAITDIKAVAGAARDGRVISVIDNTFASPIHQNPLALGIDVVVHRGTKYLGGHSDLGCGAVLSSMDHMTRIRSSAANFGGSLNTWTCALLERRLKTLAVRMEKQTATAAQLATYLQKRPQVTAVHYPGLDSHPDHAVAKRQMTGFGAMLAFELDERRIRIDRFLQRLKLVTPAQEAVSQFKKDIHFRPSCRT